MLKKVTVFSLLLALVSFPVLAQDDVPVAAADDDALPEGSIDVDMTFVSNYVFRGADLFTNAAVQNGESLGAHTGAWAFQPSITFNGPEGLYFGIWTSFAMENRSDQDVDQLLQRAPGDTDNDLLANGCCAEVLDALGTGTDTITAGLNTSAGADDGLPGYYREENGLDRLDEVDFSFGYAADTTVGAMDFGIVSYMQPNTRGKDGFALTELYVSYSLPFLSDVSFAAYSDINSSNQYYNVGYGSGIDITDGVSFDYGVGVGYGVQTDIKGIQDITGSVGISAYGFSIAYNFSVRPTAAFFDSDGGAQSGEWWLLGQSTTTDGLVADPALTNGLINSAINSVIDDYLEASLGLTDDSTFVYTPRQKLPRTVWWISVGYGFSI